MTVDTHQEAGLALTRLGRVDLATVVAHAALLERVDRKYIVPVGVVHDLIGSLAGSHRVLAIGDRQSTRYRTTYYDTARLTCVRDHVQGRRRRFKARSRLYVEDELCRLEVKTKNRRGATVKTQLDVPPDTYGSLSPEQRLFIRTSLADAGMEMPDGLEPSLELSYVRTTLIDLEHGVRVTFDTDVTSRRGDDGISLDPNHVIVETKGAGRAGLADVLLRRSGYRPRSFSKYAAMGSLLEPSISDNAFRPMVGVQLHHQGAR